MLLFTLTLKQADLSSLNLLPSASYFPVFHIIVGYYKPSVYNVCNKIFQPIWNIFYLEDIFINIVLSIQKVSTSLWQLDFAFLSLL